MCRAADLVGIGHHDNELDESELDIVEVAKEMPLTPIIQCLYQLDIIVSTNS
jgi:hypothetical protein